MAEFAGYRTVASFRTFATVSGELVDACERLYPGFLAESIRLWGNAINEQLSLRYAIPFSAPYPAYPIIWTDRLVKRDLYDKMGYQPSSVADEAIAKQAETCLEQIKLAADAENGLYNLPLLAGTSASGVSRGGPRVYSEQSPYVGFDRQAAVARTEDANLTGSRR